jgi:hypothetical protein
VFDDLTLYKCSTIDHIALSNSDADPLPSPLHDNWHISTCFVCSLLEWARQSSPTNPRDRDRPSFVTAGENPRPFSSITTTSTRMTLVDEEAQRITPRPWFSFGNLIPVYGRNFLGYQSASNQNFNLDDISIPCRDPATTSV